MDLFSLIGLVQGTVGLTIFLSIDYTFQPYRIGSHTFDLAYLLPTYPFSLIVLLQILYIQALTHQDLSFSLIGLLLRKNRLIYINDKPFQLYRIASTTTFLSKATGLSAVFQLYRIASDSPVFSIDFQFYSITSPQKIYLRKLINLSFIRLTAVVLFCCYMSESCRS